MGKKLFIFNLHNSLSSYQCSNIFDLILRRPSQNADLASYQYPKILISFSGNINKISGFHNFSDPSLDQHRHKPCPTHLTMDPKVHEPPLDHIAWLPRIFWMLGIEHNQKKNLNIKLLCITMSNVLLSNFIHKNFNLLSKFIHDKLKF